MKTLTLVAKVAMATILVVGLTACGKKKNGSKTASTPGSTCTRDTYGNWVDRNGNYCQPTGTTTICPSSGWYRNSQGQQVQCVPGQPVNNGGYPNNPGYPYNPYPQQGNYCSQYYWQYGVHYVPMILQGQYVCVRYDLVYSYAGYSQNHYYQDYGHNYWYAYPPYEGSGNNCTPIEFGGQCGYVNVCF